MSEPRVTYEVRDGVATITLSRPRVLNALDLALSAELAEAAEAAARDEAVWVVVVRGAGRAFCSGMDRTVLSAGGIGEAFYRNWIRALNRLEDMDKLVGRGAPRLLDRGRPAARGGLRPAAGHHRRGAGPRARPATASFRTGRS